jgi:methylmalonyl-CoA/ethylmalonyl-CoA epimerase
MNLANASIGQLMIPVDDVDAAIVFYRDVLGLPFLFAAPPQMAFFMCGAVRLLVGVLPPGQAAQRGSAIYFNVGDIHAMHAALSAKGVAFAHAPHVVHRTPQSELWLAQFADPDGNQLLLMSDVPGAAPAST